MIDYSRFWSLIKQQNISCYTLVNKYHISPSILNRMKHGQYIRTCTLEKLCSILHVTTPGELVSFHNSHEI